MCNLRYLKSFNFAIFFFLLSSASFGATYTVSNTTDAGAGSLRQAIIDANTNVGADVITISATGALTLSTGGLPTITGEVSITGPGPLASTFTINGADNFQILTLGSNVNVSFTLVNFSLIQ